jgi:hypothetical protein
VINPPSLIAAGLCVALLVGGYVTGRADGRAACEQARAAERYTAERAARTAAVTHFRTMEVAYAAHTLEIQKLRAAAARANHAARGLRDDLAAIRQRLAGDAGAACPAALDTCHAVLGDCGERYRDLAHAADEHAADARLCIEGWPR